MPVGAAFEVSSDSEYGDVIVNGSLIVKPGVTLTVTNLYVGQVAADATPPAAPASVEVQAGASVVNVKTSVVGDGGPASFTMQKGAKLQSSGLTLGSRDRIVAADAGVYVRLVLNNATAEINGRVNTNVRSSDAANEVVRVELNGSDALMSCRDVWAWGKKAQACFAFGGGMMKFTQWYEYDKAGSFQQCWVDNEWQAQSLAFESVDGHPIHFYLTRPNPIFQLKTSGSCWVVLRGEGPFLLEGNATRPFVHGGQYEASGTFRFENAGGLVVSSGMTLSVNANSATKLVTAPKVRVAYGGKIDLNGVDLALDELEVAGAVTNSSETAATLTVGKDGGDVLFAVPPPAADLPIVKTGAGTLRMPDGTLENLTVSSGTVEFLNRRDVGFPYYRFYVDETAGDWFALNEVAFMDGEEDVTGEWTAISRIEKGGYYWGAPTGAVDRVDTTDWGDFSRSNEEWGAHNGKTNRSFFVTHFGGAPSYSFSWYMWNNGTEQAAEVWTNPAAPLVPASFCRTLTGYRMKAEKIPAGWRVSGGFADGITANVWQDLDVVRGAARSGDLAWTQTYALSYTNAAVSVGSLTLADGARWELDVGQGRLTLESLALGGGGTLVLRNFARVSDLRTLPVAVVSCETAANLEKWTVTCEGREDKKRRLVLRDGVLCTESTLGSLFLVR